MIPTRRIAARRWYAAVAGLVTWIGLGLQLYVNLLPRLASGTGLIAGIFNYLSYFTILTNLFAALALCSDSRRGFRTVHLPVSQRLPIWLRTGPAELLRPADRICGHRPGFGGARSVEET